jgi:hypothetical protein
MQLFQRSKRTTSSPKSVVGRNWLRVQQKLSWRHYAFAGIGALVLAGGILLLAASPPPPLYSGKLLGMNASFGDLPVSQTSTLTQLGVNSERGDIEFDGTVFADPAYDTGTATLNGTENWIDTLTTNHIVPLPLMNQYIEMSKLDIGSYSSTNGTVTSTGFTGALVTWCKTYCAGGSFYTNNTQANASYAPQVLEILNEPYGNNWWGYPVTSTDVDAYASLLKSIRAGLNSAGLNNISITAAANNNWDGYQNWDTQLVSNGGFAAAQGIAIHPYNDPGNIVIPTGTVGSGVEGWGVIYYVHQLLAGTPGLSAQANNLYLTEDGWCTVASDDCSPVVTQSQKDANIGTAINQLATVPWIKGLWYFNLHDYGSYSDGLYSSTSGNAVSGQTPAFGAFQTAATTTEAQYPSEFSLSSSTAPPPPPSPVPPTVSMSAPAPSASLSGTTTVSATASAASGASISSVQFQLNGANLGSPVTKSPYTYSWNTTTIANGTYTLTAIATDSNNATTTASKVSVTVDNSTVSSPVGYSVSGNVIRSASGAVFTPHGVDRPTLEWDCQGEGVAGGEGIPASDYTTMHTTWGANTVRIALDQDFWLPNSARAEADPTHCGVAYQKTVEATVAAARAAGLVVILDLHTSDAGNLNATGPTQQQCMPDVNSQTFWTSVANIYKGDPGVWFELYNEPHPNNWNIWQNGGSVCGFQAVGMQSLVNTVRATGATNIVLAGGDNYASTLSGAPLLSGTNIAYAIHPYANPSDPSGWNYGDWDNRFGNLATQVPVIATEFGNPQPASSCTLSTYDATDSNTNTTQGILAYFRTHGIGYTAWAWFADTGDANPCGFPVLVTNTQGACYLNDGGCATQQDMLGFANGSLKMVVPGQSTAPPPPPPTVQNFTWDAATKTLHWTAYPGATAYTIAVVQNPTTTRNTTYTWPEIVGTSYTPPPLSNQTVHYGIIPVVENSDGSYSAVTGSTWASEISVTWPAIADTTPPSQPTGLTATAATSSQINLKWTASTDNVGVTGYRIYRSTTNTTSSLITTVTTTSYGDTGLSPNTNYTYYVVAIDAAGNTSPQSANASATTQASTGTVTVEGVVTNSTNGQPIDGAYVHTGIYGTANGAATAYTNSSGQYTLVNITPTPRVHEYSYSDTKYKSQSFQLTFPAGLITKNVSLVPLN